MSKPKRKRGGRPRKALQPQTADAALRRLARMRSTDPDRNAVADIVMRRLLGRDELAADEDAPSPGFRVAAAGLLTPADYRRHHGADVYAEGVYTVRAATNARDHFAPKITARVDGEGRRWTEDEVRERLVVATAILRRTRFPSDEVPSSKVVATFEVIRTWAEIWELVLYGLDEPRITEAAPTPAEIQLLDDTLPWLFAVADRRQRACVLLRAQRKSWRAIARMCDGINDKTAKALEGRGVALITAALNGRQIGT